MKSVEELTYEAMDLVKHLETKYKVMEIIIILNIANHVYQSSAIKQFIDSKKEFCYDKSYS